MKTLRVSNIGGLFHEMFDPSPSLDMNLAIQNGFLDASSFFWAKHLEKGAIQQLVQILKLNITRTQMRPLLSNVSNGSRRSFLTHRLHPSLSLRSLKLWKYCASCIPILYTFLSPCIFKTVSIWTRLPPRTSMIIV